jgi:hypothetical protein
MHIKSMEDLRYELESLCHGMMPMYSRISNDFVMQMAISMGLSFNSEVAGTFLATDLD